MSWNKLFPIMTVAFLMLCPLFVMAADGDSNADDAAEKAIVLDFKDVDDKSLVKVVNERSVIGDIVEAFGAKMPGPSEPWTGIEYAAYMEKISLTEGYKSTKGDNGFVREELSSLSVDFVIKIVVTGKTFHFADVDVKDYIGGDGYKEYTSFLNTTFNQNDVIELSGTVKKEQHKVLSTGVCKNGYGNLLKSSEMDICGYCNLAGKISYNGNAYDVRCEDNYRYVLGSEVVFSKDPSEVKENDPCKLITDGVMKDCGLKFDLRKNGKTMDVSVDNDKRVEKSKSHSESESTAMFISQGSIEEACAISVYDLDYLNDYVKSLTPQKILGLTLENGGTITENVWEFDTKAKSIDGDAAGKSNDDVTMMLYIAFGIIIVLIVIVALAVWFTKYRA